MSLALLRASAALLLLAACASATSWQKAGADSATRDKDLTACQQDLRYSSDEARRRDTRIAIARGETSVGRGSSYEALGRDLDASTQRRKESKALSDCMQAKGYTEAR
ncbi:MAG: hypothetical protein ACOVKO_01555 [Elstera sp.]